MALTLLSRTSLKHRVFWTAQREAEPEVSSDDPLALDYVAQQYGYELFGSFTTRTTRAQYYPMVLFGLRLASSRPSHAVPWSVRELLERFELWERVWALGVLEARGGELTPEDSDGFRGVQGAKRQWRRGTEPLSLEFKLLSRQSELGALGAYLTSLRDVGLVTPGGYEPTPAAEDLLDAFLLSPEGGHPHAFVRLADEAIQARRLPRKRGHATLKTLGSRTRLGAITARREQQGRLWNVLFQEAKDDTLAIAKLLMTDHRSRKTMFDTAGFLRQAASGHLGGASRQLREKLDGARRLGEASRQLMSAFNSMYGYLANGQLLASEKELLRDALDAGRREQLRKAATRLIAHDFTRDFLVRLPLHGTELHELFQSLSKSRSDRYGELILRYHEAVQRQRGAGASWIARRNGEAYLAVTDYRAYGEEARFPTFKFLAVRRILKDLGKLS